MSNPIVVDVGNTCIKWGRAESDQVRDLAFLPADEENAWQAQWQAWEIQRAQPWIVSGVHPQRRDALVAWLQTRAEQVDVLTSYRQLPLQLEVEAPEKVGIDRLLNAVAANRRRPAPAAAILIDAGSAVTVDYVDEAGVFRGGAILPGLRLMAQALHDYTALLPLVSVEPPTRTPGTSTVEAIQLGVYHAVLGGVERLIFAYEERWQQACETYVTGGDAIRLRLRTAKPVQLWPAMTLEGILHSRPR